MNNDTLIVLLGCLATLITIMTPIIRLNTSITTLNVTMENIQKNSETTKCEQEIKNKEITTELCEHRNKLSDCDKRIFTLESWKDNL